LKSFAMLQAIDIRSRKFDLDASELLRTIVSSVGPPERTSRLLSILFSFNGRLSIQKYWLGYLAVLVAMTTLALLTVLLLVGLSLDRIRQDMLVSLMVLPFWWPFTALVLKRLHDFGHGWPLCSPYVVLGVSGTVLSTLGYDLVANVAVLLVVCYVIIVGAIRG